MQKNKGTNRTKEKIRFKGRTQGILNKMFLGNEQNQFCSCGMESSSLPSLWTQFVEDDWLQEGSCGSGIGTWRLLLFVDVSVAAFLKTSPRFGLEF